MLRLRRPPVADPPAPVLPGPRRPRPAAPEGRRRVLGLVALALLAAPAAAAPPGAVGFAPLEGFAGLGETRAVAVAPDGRVAAGGDDGVRLAAPPEAARRVLRRGPVHDLVFEPDGTLLAATGRGLFAVAPDGRVRDLGPGPGAARRVRRVAAVAGLRVAATAAGVFAGHGGRMARLDAGLPSGEVAALALSAAEPGAAPWLHALVEGDLWRARLVDGARGWRAREVSRLVLEGFAGDALDVAADPGGVVVLSDRALASGPPGGVLHPRRLDLPPGAAPRRLARAAGRLWLATDAGLLALDLEDDPVRARRAAPPAGAVGAHDVAARDGVLLVASARGLLAGAPDPGAGSVPPAAPARARFDHEPPVRAVHRAALAWLELGPEPVRGLRRRARRRGWLPTLEIRGGYEGGRRLADEKDETFTGGELRRFHDVDRDRDRGFDALVVLRWDLGDAVFHPEEVDVSREAREVIELRDEVLDEINQLYHERRRVLLEAARRPAGDPEAARLRLRAEELGAGLDAWTGGWWSLRLGAAPPSASPVRSPERTQP